MLQEATRAINSAFNNSFIKKLSQYLHDCVREEVKSSTFRNLKADRDNKWIFLDGEDTLFTQGLEYIRLEGSDSKLTELMLQSESGTKDKYLIYGHLFLVGKSKSGRKNEFLTPLLYSPCRLERNGVNINCMLTDEFISLNTGALTSLMAKSDDEDATEQLLAGLLDVVPTVPITQEKMDIFLTTLKSIVPQIDISLNHEMDVKEDNVSKDFYNEKITGDNVEEIVEEEETSKKTINYEQIHLTNQCAIILTKRPAATAGVLHELIQISEKPSGVYRETVLNVVNEEYTQSKPVDCQQKTLADFFPVTPLSLSDAQLNVIKNVENSKLVSVFGPPGTGKSQTIVNLVAHLIANGKTVLVASRMDKAVDVVADRLNELGAPFLALRAGRLNYQRELSMKLQDLLAGKVDLDDSTDSAIMCDIPDMEALLKAITDSEAKAETIIKLEGEWNSINEEIKLQEATHQNDIYIKSILKSDEIKAIETIIDTLNNNMEKSGFFASIKNSSSVSKLKKLLKLKSFDVTNENLIALKVELEYAKLICQARMIENKIQVTGNVHVLSEQIRTMRKKQKKLAIDILKSKRREALKGLMRDSVKRQRIFVHSKSLVERRQNLQNRLLETEDFKPLLEAFPCWCVTSYAVSGSLPLKPGLFDVVIIDEASQCDIASCFPLLYRAKKAVVVGDDKQLPHLSFLEKAKEQSFLSQYGITDRYQLMWRFRTNSMFDLANYYSMHPVLLDEHFRSLPPVINYSNKEFYGNRIRVMRRNDNSSKVLEAVVVPDGKIDVDATRNLPEIEAVVKKLHEIVIEDERKNPDNPVSIGIISPFRAQVDQLKISVAKVLSEHMMEKHKIEIGTAHTFQGDERDIMLISWAYANNSFPQSLIFLQKPNLFNVAITRARFKTINFISKDPRELPEGILRSYFGFIQEYEDRYKLINSDEFDENIYKNSFEKEVAESFRALGHTVLCGTEIAGLSADLLIDDKFIVECDGVDDKIPSKVSNMKKQTIFERTGLKVSRISKREWQYSEKACIDRVINCNL
ncbi:MAG: AAA domain-containing protein [bacterium]|nr:AAA domain-containing protein [bacterium]